jgi:hypothetical protein
MHNAANLNLNFLTEVFFCKYNIFMNTWKNELGPFHSYKNGSSGVCGQDSLGPSTLTKIYGYKQDAVCLSVHISPQNSYTINNNNN